MNPSDKTHIACYHGLVSSALVRNLLPKNNSRNIRRFPPEFMFQLTDDEWSDLRSQNVTSKGRGGLQPRCAGAQSRNPRPGNRRLDEYPTAADASPRAPFASNRIYSGYRKREEEMTATLPEAPTTPTFNLPLATFNLPLSTCHS